MAKRLLPEDRLETLRAADLEQKWYSLDDKRVCTVCDRVFTGRQIEISRDSRGKQTLKCPTPGCPSTIRHWFLCKSSPPRYRPSPARSSAVLRLLKPQLGRA